MEALKRANDIRVRRAQLKKDLKSGEVSIEQILREPPDQDGDRSGRVALIGYGTGVAKALGQRQELIALFNR